MEMTPTPQKVNGFPAGFECNALAQPAIAGLQDANWKGGVCNCQRTVNVEDLMLK